MVTTAVGEIAILLEMGIDVFPDDAAVAFDFEDAAPFCIANECIAIGQALDTSPEGAEERPLMHTALGGIITPFDP